MGVIAIIGTILKAAELAKKIKDVSLMNPVALDLRESEKKNLNPYHHDRS